MTASETYTTESDTKNRRTVFLIYILYFLGLVVGVSSLVGIVLAHAKSGSVSGIWQSHLTYQIRTFWYGFLMLMIGLMLSTVIIGIFVLLWLALWMLVRCGKGFLAANDSRAIERPYTWFW